MVEKCLILKVEHVIDEEEQEPKSPSRDNSPAREEKKPQDKAFLTNFKDFRHEI